jgi:hypothetical protein
MFKSRALNTFAVLITSAIVLGAGWSGYRYATGHCPASDVCGLFDCGESAETEALDGAFIPSCCPGDAVTETVSPVATPASVTAAPMTAKPAAATAGAEEASTGEGGCCGDCSVETAPAPTTKG